MANNFSQSKRGVVILYAVLLVSVVLTISLGVFNITYRQLVLSSLTRESEVAFSVADTARNCAMYWDSSEREFSRRPFWYYKYDSGTGSTVLTSQVPVQPANCANLPLNVTSNSGPITNTSAFQLKFEIPDPNDSTKNRPVCAKVLVEKNVDLLNQQTIITADGYNLSAPGGGDCTPLSNNRAVNREIQTVISG